MANDDLSFEQLMALEGVQQLKPKKGAAKTVKGLKPSRPAPPPPPKLPPNPLAATVAELEAERDRLAAELADAQATIEGIRRDLAAALAATADAEDLAATAEQTADATAVEVRTLQEQLQGEKDALTLTLQARSSVAQVLEDRGCASDFEMLEVLNGLLLQRPREFLEALVLADAQSLAKVLVDRVAFVCRDVEFTADANTVVVHVPKARCEISGGSDTRATFHGFVQACVDRDVRKVTIVGGSPAYRRQLKALADEHDEAPSLNLVSGTRRREKRRAEADLRGSDLVVLWGGSELDHSVTSSYRGGPAQLVRASHRGISGMLAQARSALRKKR